MELLADGRGTVVHNGDDFGFGNAVELHGFDSGNGAGAGHGVFGKGLPVVLIAVHIFEEVFEGIGGLGSGIAFGESFVQEGDELIIDIFAEVFADPEEVLPGKFINGSFLGNIVGTGVEADGGAELEGSGFVGYGIDFAELIGDIILKLLGEEVAGIVDDRLDEVIVEFVLFGDIGESLDDVSKGGFDLLLSFVVEQDIEIVHVAVVFVHGFSFFAVGRRRDGCDPGGVGFAVGRRCLAGECLKSKPA